MNKLVIIGNGFDLAHGLPTSYGDFINWYWRDVLEKIPDISHSNFKNDFIEIQLLFKQQSIKTASEEYKKVVSYKELITFTQKYSEAYSAYYAEQHDRCFIKFSNAFFRNICEKHSIQNWVDIENEYYRLLKDCLKESDNTKVKKLNEEFEQVKNLLERYLKEEVENKFNLIQFPNLGSKLLEFFEIKERNLDYKSPAFDDNYLDEFPKTIHKELVEVNDLISKYPKDRPWYKIRYQIPRQHNLFLNFNYTQSLYSYIHQASNGYDLRPYGIFEQIQIHGRLIESDNKINFGFGDEMDDHYKQIEEKDDNEYLKYIKSFQYLQNSNYKKVLDFIDGDIFQVYIMGHSCGLSDRILLNTIFEHTNCVSIKVFYHQRADGSDNYTEIVQNISRHFNKKKMMRDKIVNKSLCQELPQDIRFEKLNTP